MAHTRRDFLKRGALGGAVLVVGGVSLGAWQGELRFRPTMPLEVFDAFSFGVMAAAAEAVLAGQAFDPVVVAHRMDTAAAYAPPESQADLNQLTRALNSPLLGLVLDGRPRPFISLDVEGRARVLERWRHSALDIRKSGYDAIRKLVAASYYSDSSTWAGIGYPGPPVSVKR